MAVTCSILCFSQNIKAKDKTIFNANFGQEKMVARLFYENDKLVNVKIQYIGRDHRYTKITKYINVAYGTPSEVCYLLTTAIKFLQENNDNGTSTFIDKQMLSINKTLGKYLSIYEKDGNGYHTFTPGQLKNAKDELLDFCKENQIEVSCDEPPTQEAVTEGTNDNKPKQSTTDDKLDRLKKLKSLLDEGILTQEEFDAEKKKILETE
jgi:hypothetical protein